MDTDLERWQQAGLIAVPLILLAGIALLLAGGQTQQDPLQGFSVERLNFTAIDNVMTVAGRLAFIGSNATGDYLVHGDTIIAAAGDLTAPAYNGTTWGYAVNTSGQLPWQFHIGDRVIDRTFAIPHLSATRGWNYGGRVADGFLLVVAGTPVRFQSLQAEVIGDRLAYVQWNGDTASIVYGGETIATGVTSPTLLDIGGDLAYSHPTDRQVTVGSGNASYTISTTVIEYGDTTLGENAFRTFQAVKGDDGELYYLGQPNASSSTVQLVRNNDSRVIASANTSSGITDLQPAGGSIAFIDTGDGYVYVDGRRLQYSGLTPVPGTLRMVGGTPVFQATRQTTTGNRTVRDTFLVYGDRRIDVPGQVVATAAVNGRLVFFMEESGTYSLVHEKE